MRAAAFYAFFPLFGKNAAFCRKQEGIRDKIIKNRYNSINFR